MKALEKYYEKLNNDNSIKKTKLQNAISYTTEKQLVKKSDPLSVLNKFIAYKYKGITDKEIDLTKQEYEEEWHEKLNLPDEYKEFLFKHNGCFIYYDAMHLFGYQAINRTNFEKAYPYPIKINFFNKNIIVIGGYSYDHTSIAIFNRKIYVINPKGIIFNIWDNLEIFLEEEILRLEKIFRQDIEPSKIISSNILPKNVLNIKQKKYFETLKDTE